MASSANEIATMLLDRLGIPIKGCTRVTLDLIAGNVAKLEIEFVVDATLIDGVFNEVVAEYQLIRRNQHADDH